MLKMKIYNNKKKVIFDKTLNFSPIINPSFGYKLKNTSYSNKCSDLLGFLCLNSPFV